MRNRYAYSAIRRLQHPSMATGAAVRRQSMKRAKLDGSRFDEIVAEGLGKRAQKPIKSLEPFAVYF
jgi:hypothetical protein